MSAIFIRNARVLTLAGNPGARRGAAMRELGVMEATDVYIAGTRIAVVGQDLTYPPDGEIIDAGGRVLMPSFIDCHTHLCFAGSRLDEWEQKLSGVAYLDILSAGGGIMSTVRATRATSQAKLEELLLERLELLLSEGTTSVEIKSGYGLSTDDELKMLRAIAGAAKKWAGTIVPTALIGHAIDPDVPAPTFVHETICETLPAIHSAFPGIAIDAFCEKNAWSVDDCVRLFMQAAELGHPIRVHADQFNSLGMVPNAIKLGARTIDHLEASTPEDLKAIAASNTTGVVLPACGFHLDGRYANGRALIDAGGALALATNCNPGSAPCYSMPMAIALGVRHCGLTPAEAIVAATTNAANVLNLHDRGTVEQGKRADLVLLRHKDERSLAYEFGGSCVDVVIARGKVVGGASEGQG
jgi:imidazolonepropionase